MELKYENENFLCFLSNLADNLTVIDIFFYYTSSFREVSSIKVIVFLYYCCLFNIGVISIQLWNNSLQKKFCHKQNFFTNFDFISTFLPHWRSKLAAKYVRISVFNYRLFQTLGSQKASISESCERASSRQEHHTHTATHSLLSRQRR